MSIPKVIIVHVCLFICLITRGYAQNYTDIPGYMSFFFIPDSMALSHSLSPLPDSVTFRLSYVKSGDLWSEKIRIDYTARGEWHHQVFIMTDGKEYPVEWPLEEIYIRRLWRKLLEDNVLGISGFRESPIEIIGKNGRKTQMPEEAMDKLFIRDPFYCITLRNHIGIKMICYPDIVYAIEALDRHKVEKLNTCLNAPSWRQFGEIIRDFVTVFNPKVLHEKGKDIFLDKRISGK